MLNDFEDIFKTPTELPPIKSHEHKIPLIKGCRPPSSRPYKCDHFHKTEIEKCVNELKESDYIRASNSPFSSLVLLVKKKDDT